jgi:hypothetical protein
MIIAKMGTRYPDYHGEGYYNFLMADSQEELNEKLENNKHDFYLINTHKTRIASVDRLMELYPTKQKLNEKYFNAKV